MALSWQGLWISFKRAEKYNWRISALQPPNSSPPGLFIFHSFFNSFFHCSVSQILIDVKIIPSLLLPYLDLEESLQIKAKSVEPQIELHGTSLQFFEDQDSHRTRAG